MTSSNASTIDSLSGITERAVPQAGSTRTTNTHLTELMTRLSDSGAMPDHRAGAARAASGYSGSTSPAPTAAPTSWAMTKPGTEAGAIPAKVSVNARPMVTAGLAKTGRGGEPVRGADVRADRGGRDGGPAGAGQGEDEQDQAGGGDDLTEPQMTGGPVLGREVHGGQVEHRFARTDPAIAPAIWATM